MKKQTAVEWLLDQLEQKGDMRETRSIRNLQLNIDTSDYLYLKRQAKAMEKEQMVHCYEQAYREGYIDNGKSGEQYYNETYGGDK